MGRASDVGPGDSKARDRRQGNGRSASLHFERETQRETVRSRRPRSLGNREHVPLEPGHDIPRRREPSAGSTPGGEPGMVASLRTRPAQAAPRRQDELSHETPPRRLEQYVPRGSPVRNNDLVCASPDGEGGTNPWNPQLWYPGGDNYQYLRRAVLNEADIP